MLTWAHERSCHAMRLGFEPGKPNQDAYIELVQQMAGSAMSREERGWFTSLAHAQAMIETWRREYNEELTEEGARRPDEPALYANATRL